MDVEPEAGVQELLLQWVPAGTVRTLGSRFSGDAIMPALTGDEIEPFDKSFRQAATAELGFGHDDETAVILQNVLYGWQGLPGKEKFGGECGQDGVETV